MTRRIICFKLKTFKSIKHERMHAKDVKNVVKKAYC